MTTKRIIVTDAAPQAIGTYSQAVQIGNTVYLSGQIPLDPETMSPVVGDIRMEITQVFRNLSAVADATDGSLSDIVKLNIYLIDLEHFPVINEIMAEFFAQPFPARAVVGVAQLPKNARVEMDAVLVLPGHT